MEQSVLNIIPANDICYIYDEWRNGKLGGFVQKDGIYRFREMIRDKNGNPVQMHDKDEENPIVVIGIAAYWLMFNSKKETILKQLTQYKSGIPQDIRELFDNYTTIRFEQFRKKYRDDPNTWDWDWEYEFYVNTIIPDEIAFNKRSEALFDYISDSDIVLVRAVMNNYIKYLKKVRTEKGYYVNPELLVLRAIDSMDDTKLEDMEDSEVDTIFEQLEKKGYVKVARIEGHKPEDVKLLDKGRVYMKLLEKGKSKKPPRLKQLTWEDEKRCFKDAVIYVLELKNNEGNYLFENNTQWIAVYRFAVDSGIMYDVNDPEEPKDKSTPQYAVFENFLHNLQLDIEPPIRIPFKKDYIDKLSKNTYVRYNTHHPWSKDGITDPRSSTLYKELEGVYLTLEKKYNKLVRQAEKNIV